MNIPDEVVKAASWAVLRGMNARHHAYKIAYAALEAAAPYIAAQAWEQGWDARAWGEDRDSPYRAAETKSLSEISIEAMERSARLGE